MNNLKRAIRILNASGGSFTSAKRALLFVSQGRARYVNETTIRMIEEDYRVLSAARSVEGENCRAPIRPTPIPATAYTAEMWEGCGFGEADYRTFAPYPDQTARLF